MMSFDEGECEQARARRFSISELVHPVMKDKSKILYKMRIRKHIQSYIRNLKNYTLVRSTAQLKPLHYELINDRACPGGKEAETEHRQSSLRQLTSKARIVSSRTLVRIQKVSKLQKLRFRLPIIHQGSKFFVFWNCFVLLCILYNFYLIPLRLVYQDSFYRLECHYAPFVILQLCVFLLDILLIANTSIVVQDKIVTDRKQIFYAYFKSNRFAKDLVSILGFLIIAKPFFYPNCSQTRSLLESLLSFLFFVKYSKIQTLYNKMERQITLSQNLLTAVKLLRLMINFLMIAHYVVILSPHKP